MDRLSPEEAQRALEGLAPQLNAYAELIVRKGINVQPNQEVVLTAPVERADFTKTLVEKAYKAGAGHVTIIWSDSATRRLEFENCSVDYFKTIPTWQKELYNGYAREGACFLFLEGTDPAAFEGIDPAKVMWATRTRNQELRDFRDGMDFGKNVWCIAGVAVEAWARKVFDGLTGTEAIYRLWEAILAAARADGEDPQGTWETHNATFEKNKRLLNENAFVELHYTSKNGTDLRLGLNKGHIWEGGAALTQGGIPYFPNIPTEEVFTTPNRTKCEGIVYSAMPLVHSGQIIDGFWLQFNEGKVVDFGAKQGKEALQHILDTDENARRLGECALISKNTPIRQSGILFFDTLYDENASCHLALGMGFPECIEGGVDMDKDALLAHGVNQSTTHVDFMIGSDDLNVTGICADGREVAIFQNGQWAWENE